MEGCYGKLEDRVAQLNDEKQSLIKGLDACSASLKKLQKEVRSNWRSKTLEQTKQELKDVKT